MIPTQRTVARSLGRIRVQAATQAPVVAQTPKIPGITDQERMLVGISSTPSETRRLARRIGVHQLRGFATTVSSR